MATLSSIGIGSGLNANSIISQLVALERRPIEQLKTEAGRIDAKLSSFGRIQSALDALRSAARTLADTSTWRAASATSADPAAIGVTASANSAPGSYAVQVNALAAAQMNATSAVADSATPIGQGTLTFEVGRWADDLSSFTPKDGTAPVSISIGPGEDTLEKIRDKINATQDIGVRASIVTDASGARLVLQSRDSGAASGFRVQVADADGNGGDDSGLSRLAYDPPGGAAANARTQAGRNASATINGLSVESPSNVFANVIDGVSLTLAKVTTGSVDVTVARDTASMRKSIDGFVSAYNDLVRLVREQTRYDPESKNAGTLQGDRTAIGLLSQLRASLGESSSASSVFGRLTDIGLSVRTDGTLEVSGSALDAGFAKLDELQRFFTVDSEAAGSSGLAARMRRLTDQLLADSGPMSSRQESLRQLKSMNGKRQATLEDRIALTEERLRAQYQALDASMARLNNLSGYVSQQITNWNKSTG
ncbi:MAG TPA: flagellar filament capping protein FliD [Rubrivivax sp.]|nr:flagellar filament capping protein FliD [Burkholderiales bacterium]HNU10552.1 flagellar filament capping protein FliD [Rubrivivax sp.]